MLQRYLKPVTFVLALLPLAYCAYQVILLVQGQANSLGADPGKAIVLFNGEWALRFLIITLLVTPIRKLFALPKVATLRRMLGLFCFFYASLHVAAYAVFLLELRFADIIADVVKRPYITVGASAFMVLLPLAATSNRWMIRRLKQRWKKLHQLVYVAAILVIVHLLWLTRTDYTEALAYTLAMLLLLSYRLFNLPWLVRVRSAVSLSRRRFIREAEGS